MAAKTINQTEPPTRRLSSPSRELRSTSRREAVQSASSRREKRESFSTESFRTLATSKSSLSPESTPNAPPSRRDDWSSSTAARTNVLMCTCPVPTRADRLCTAKRCVSLARMVERRCRWTTPPTTSTLPSSARLGSGSKQSRWFGSLARSTC
ncbi:MAG: hypothetical protein RL150_620 [Candidatus Parcubacteria bacterium]